MQSIINPIIIDFCKPDCDRFAFLKNYLDKNSIPNEVITIDDANHFFIKFDKKSYNTSNYTKTLVAHYDRKENSIGANDNSSAVIQLLDMGIKLKDIKTHHNIQILFTDKEEKDFKNQGSHKLARFFKEKNINNYIFFDFDMCGIGNTIILSDSSESFLETKNLTDKFIYNNLKVIKNYTMELLLQVNDGKFLNIKTPNSDNLNFVLFGFPTVLISVLPFQEALTYQIGHVNLSSDYTTFIETLKSIDNMDEKLELINKTALDIIPSTWRKSHTKYDTLDTLKDEAFMAMSNFLNGLINYQIPFKYKTGQDIIFQGDTK